MQVIVVNDQGFRFNFSDRFVIDKGTIYTFFIGTDANVSIGCVSKIEEELKRLIGKMVAMNGIVSTVIDARVDRGCNLINSAYRGSILTDEEFAK